MTRDSAAPREIYLVKHAHAGAAGKPPDENRGLSTTGSADAQRTGRHLAGMGLRPDVVIASPRPRAEQTAALIAELVGAPLKIDVRLAEACDMACLRAILSDAGDPARAFLVGHIYCFGPLVAQLTGASAEPLRSGAVARIDLSEPFDGPLRISWLAAPRPDGVGRERTTG